MGPIYMCLTRYDTLRNISCGVIPYASAGLPNMMRAKLERFLADVH
jgi:hypothetical protein